MADLAASQGGCFSRAQALDLRYTDSMVRRRLATARWRRLHPGVYGFAGVPPSSLTTLWAAVLAVGPPAAASHQAAAWLHGLPGFPPATVVTTRHPNHQRVVGATLHQLNDVAPHHVRHDLTTAPGLVVTTLARTVVDLAAVCHRSRMRILIDELVAARTLDEAALADCVGEVARQGKPGLRALGWVLDARSGGRRPSANILERRLLALVVRAGLPEPLVQMRFPGRHDVDGCVDVGWVGARLIVEADGRRWHSRIADMKRDRERDAQAARAGWQTLRFMFETIMGDEATVMATLADTYRMRMTQAA